MLVEINGGIAVRPQNGCETFHVPERFGLIQLVEK
jgi:hypothetical protein